MEVRKLSMKEIDFISGGGDYDRTWRFVNQSRINNNKYCNYVNLYTGKEYSYSAGSSASATCYPSRTTVSQSGNLTNTSPSPGHEFRGGSDSPFPSWRDRWNDFLS